MFSTFTKTDGDQKGIDSIIMLHANHFIYVKLAIVLTDQIDLDKVRGGTYIHTDIDMDEEVFMQPIRFWETTPIQRLSQQRCCGQTPMLCWYRWMSQS